MFFTSSSHLEQVFLELIKKIISDLMQIKKPGKFPGFLLLG